MHVFLYKNKLYRVSVKTVSTGKHFVIWYNWY